MNVTPLGAKTLFFVLLLNTVGSEYAWTAGGDGMTVVSVLVDEKALARPHDVELQDHLAFVPGKAGSLAIIDVADPAAPEILWFHPGVGRIGEGHMEDAETVLPMGRYLMLGSRDFISIDISDPRNPKFLKILSERPEIDKINGMVRRGNYIIAAGKEGWLSVFDIRDRVEPRFLGARNARDRDAIMYPHDIALAGAKGEFIMVVDPNGFGRTNLPGAVAVYRIADAQTNEILPVEQWELVRRIEGFDLDGANRVHVFGDYACITGSYENKNANFVVFEINSPEMIRRTAILPFPDTRGPNGLTVAGNVAFLGGGQTIGVIDVSDPLRPTYLAVFKPLDIFPDARDNAHDLVYRDGYLYVTGQNSASFGIIRIDDPKIRRLAENTTGTRRR